MSRGTRVATRSGDKSNNKAKSAKSKAKPTTAAKPSKKRRRWPFAIIFGLGLLVLSYPLITRIVYETKANQVIANYDKAREAMPKEEKQRRLRLARAYNETIRSGTLSDPFTKRQKAGVAAYAKMLEIHELIGKVEVPKIAVALPMYAGSSEVVLQKGAGHLEGTSLPVGGNNTHTVITAHRGLPEARLFSELDKIKVGDKFYITDIAGTLAYQVDQIKTVDPGDFRDLVVVPGHDYATLLTCTPYMINSHRLLVRGHRVPYVAAVEEPEMAAQESAYYFRIAFYVATGLLLICLFFLVRAIRRARRLKSALADSAPANEPAADPAADPGSDDATTG